MLLRNSNANVVFAGNKHTTDKYVHKCTKSTTTKCAKTIISAATTTRFVVITLHSTTTRLKIVSKKFRLFTGPAVRKKYLELKQRKHKQVTCFYTTTAKRTRTRKRNKQEIDAIAAYFKNSKKISLKSALCTIDTLQSNNGSYFSESTNRQHKHQQQQQQKKRHHSQQPVDYFNEKQQQQEEPIKHLQIVRLYARSGVHLRRRRKRRFFINLYTKTLQFRKLKAIKKITTLTHNNIMPLLSSISLSPSIMLERDNKITTKTTAKTFSGTFYSNQNIIESTKTRQYKQQNQQQQNSYAAEYLYEKSNDSELFQKSTPSSLCNSDEGGVWRLLLTSLIALTARTTKRLTDVAASRTAILSGITTTFIILFQRKFQYYCRLNNGLNKKYSWIFLLIYLHLSAKGE